MNPHLYPHLLMLLPSPWSRGEGPGVRGLHCVLICILIVNSIERRYIRFAPLHHRVFPRQLNTFDAPVTQDQSAELR